MKFKALLYQNPTGFIIAMVLLVLAAVSTAFNKTAAMFLLAAFAVAFIIVIIYSAANLRFTQKSIKSLNSLLSSEEGADVFPLPCFLCDKTGNIFWYNNGFASEILAGKKAGSIKASDFIDGFDYKSVTAEKSVPASFGERLFTAFITPVTEDSKPAICVYLYDDTYYKNTDTEYKLSRPFVMQILVDNIEQLSREYTDSKFALVSSGIESKIENWLRAVPSIMKKTGSGRYVVIGEKRDLDVMEKNKFSVLNEVREYCCDGENAQATLSIGVGTGDTFAECEERAKKSLDMALGRGGDQVAVYTQSGHVYYGGMSNRMNDNSKVSPRQTSANIANLLKRHELVLIEGHRFSDFDSIGAAVGMCHFADINDVKAYVVLDAKTTLSTVLVDYLKSNGFDKFITPHDAAEMCNEKTALVVVDTHREALLDCRELFELSGEQVVIDHHRRSEDFLTESEVFYHLPSSSSASEMVAEIIEYSTVSRKVPKHISTALLSGIVLDTKDYVLRTSQRTFESAGFLRDNGADTVQVRKFFAADSAMIKIKNQIIADAEIHNGFMISATEEQMPELRVIISKSADDMLTIEGVRASFVMAVMKKDGVAQISARSYGEENVQLIMERLGGGGHSTMAAAQIEAGSVEEAKSMLLKAIDEYLLSK